MNYSASEVSSALMGKLIKVLSASGLSKDTFISVIGGGGLLITAEDLDFLQKSKSTSDIGDNPFAPNPSSDSGVSGSDPEKLDHWKEFSHLFNIIPNGEGVWDYSGQTVDQMYGNWLDLAEVPIIHLTDQQKEELAQANNIIASYGDQYYTYKNAYQNAVTNVLSAQLSNANPIILKELKDKEETALETWKTKGNKASFESALAVKDQLSTQGYATLKENLKEKYENTKENTLDSQGNSFLPVNLITNKFISDESVWNEFYFTSQEISDYQSTEKQSWSGGLTIPLEDLFWVGGGTSGKKRTYIHDVKIDNFSVSFKFVRVILDRSAWYDSTLIESRCWWWEGATEDAPTSGGLLLSDGKMPNQGKWSLTPEEVIFIKEMQINIQTSDNYTKKTFEEIHEHAKVGFLCFSLGGEDYNYSKNTKTHTFTSKNGTLKADGMQIAAFICSKMPQEPNPEPALLKDK